MSTTVRFDALPASVRASLFQLTQSPGRDKLESNHPQMASTPRGSSLIGLSITGLVLGPVLVLGLWVYAGGPFMAARFTPVLLTLASLWFFAGVAHMLVDFYAEHVETLSDGDFLYAGTLVRIAGPMVTVLELTPASNATHEVSSYEHREVVYQYGKRYLKTSKRQRSVLKITAVGVDGTTKTFSRDASKLDGALHAHLANERFARWHQARARNDHQTMAALDPFAQCYLQRSLEQPEPGGPKRVLASPIAKGALFFAVASLGWLPAIYNALSIE